MKKTKLNKTGGKKDMNKILITFAVIGILAILAFGTFSFVQANKNSGEITQDVVTENSVEGSCYSQCQGQCTAESNCGSSSCGARTGGTCRCRA